MSKTTQRSFGIKLFFAYYFDSPLECCNDFFIRELSAESIFISGQFFMRLRIVISRMHLQMCTQSFSKYTMKTSFIVYMVSIFKVSVESVIKGTSVLTDTKPREEGTLSL